MGDPGLEVECLEQLRDYVISLGGDWNDDWKCRAQIRDYGSRAGSVDTWFTSPDGEVFRSKVAAARALGLDCSKGTNTKRPKAARKPASTRAAAAGDRSGGDRSDGEGGGGAREKAKEKGGGAKEASKWAGAVAVAATPRPVDLTMEEIGELLMSMPDATDCDDCYEGPLFYKEAQLKHAAKLAARAAAAAAAKEAEEREAAELAAAQAASLEEARRREERDARRRERGWGGNDADMADGEGDEQGKGSGDEGGAKEGAAVAEEEEEDDDRGRRGRGGGRRATRQSLAAAVAAAAALLQSQSGMELPAHMVAAVADAGDLLEEGGDDYAAALPPPGPPQLDQWSVELEVIRKCFVKVPVRLGRPAEDDPVALSPSDRVPDLTRALLTLSAGEAAGSAGDGAPREGAAPLAHWQLKRFPLDQLTANEGEPAALHPAALFYLRHLEEEIEQEERAVRREAEERAARKEAKRLERANATGPDGAPRAPLPKPANLSLRGKSIEEVEDALMERLASYVGDLGGTLPEGWRVKASIRQNGANAGGVDAYYYDPAGRRHKSMIKVAEVLGLEASAAAKPKTLASILGTTSKRRPTVEDDMEMMDRPGGVIFAGEGEEPEAPAAAAAAGGDAADGDLGGGSGGEGADGGGGERESPGLDGGDGSARKTCGVCRTCLNPQLKKGCLANKARTGPKSRSRQAMDSSPSPSPPPPKKLTARQMAKIERQAREAAERQAMRAAAEVAAAADEGGEEEGVHAGAEAGGDATAKDSEDSEIDIVGGGPAAGPSAGTSAEAAEPAPGSDGPSVDPPQGEGQAPAPEAAAAMEVDAGDGGGDVVVAPAAGDSPKPNGGQRSGSAASEEGASGGDGGGGKRARGEGATDGAGGSGSGADDEGERQLKRPRQEAGESAEDGAPRPAPRDPYPRRERKQVKPQPPPGHPPPPDPDAKKKQEAEKAARRAKRKLDDTVRNAYDKAYNRLKGQLSRLRQEQALVEAYAADGWRGASREKVKPVSEIKRAKAQIMRCREAIRECVRVADEAEGDVPIPKEFYDEEGELDLDHIFCSKCRGNDSTDDNDIILCDGPCDRAYHVKCLVPPVDPAALPEDEGWLCPACDRKIDMIDDINDEFGTEYEYDTPWEAVLAPGTLPASPEGAAAAGVDLGRLESWLEGADLPSEDEEDEDYAASGSEDEGPAGGEGGEGEDGAGGGGGGGEDGGAGGDSGSESDDEASSLASEDLGGEILDVQLTAEEREALAARYAMPDSSDAESEEKLIVEGKRRRTAVDYRALNAEMFGDAAVTPDAAAALEAAGVDEGGDSDEGWSPRAQARKDREEARRRKKEEEEEEEESEEEEAAAAAAEDAGDAEAGKGEGEEGEEGGDA